MSDIKEEVKNFLYGRRIDAMFGDGMEEDYIWNGVSIQGLNEMNDEELLEELQEGFDEETPDPETENLLGRVKLVYVCSDCGSEDVHVAMWVNPNTNQILEGSDQTLNHSFCDMCDEDRVLEKKMKAV